MVRRGSPVRVRKRALQKARVPGLFGSDRLSRCRMCAGYGARHGAFRKERPALAGLSFLSFAVRPYPPRQNCRVEKRLSMPCMFAAPSPFALPAIMLVSPLEFGL